MKKEEKKPAKRSLAAFGKKPDAYPNMFEGLDAAETETPEPPAAPSHPDTSTSAPANAGTSTSTDTGTSAPAGTPASTSTSTSHDAGTPASTVTSALASTAATDPASAPASTSASTSEIASTRESTRTSTSTRKRKEETVRVLPKLERPRPKPLARDLKKQQSYYIEIDLIERLDKFVGEHKNLKSDVINAALRAYLDSFGA